MSYVLTFDLETQLSDVEVGGWHNAHHMLVSVGTGIMDRLDGTEIQKYFYTDVDVDDMIAAGCEREQVRSVKQLIEDIRNAKFVVSWNGIMFDYKVLKAYDETNYIYIPTDSSNKDGQQKELISKTVDMKALVGQYKLDYVANATLGVGKSAGAFGGLKALDWWKEYNGHVDGDDFSDTKTKNIDALRDLSWYCMDDTILTKRIFWHGIDHGNVSAIKNGVTKTLNASWSNIMRTGSATRN